MDKVKVLLLSVFVLIMAVISTNLVACEFREEYKDNNNSNIIVNDNKETTTPKEDNNENADDELPPETFVGTIIEEDTHYMVVVPNADEEEYKISTKIRVEYIHDHIDYLYGIGRKVVISYIPPVVRGSTIITDDIRHDGFEDFTLSVQYKNESIPSNFAEIRPAGLLSLIANNQDFHEYSSDYNLYYYGLYDVYVTVDGDTLPLKEALTYGKVTLDGIIADCNRLSSLGIIEEHNYKDGGSSLYDFGDFRIIKYHTLDGDRDIYIGTADMDINANNAKSFCIGAYIWKDLGLRMKAADVTPDGANIIFIQKGGNVTGELMAGEDFYLEKKDGNKWISVSTRPTIDYAFNSIAYTVKSGGKTEFKTNWKWLYDTLPEGEYRIAKSIMDFRMTADYDKQFYYAYFTI